MKSATAGIIDRMEAVREKRRDRIAELNEESNRMTDWREHVRSAPLLTLAASIAVGALGAATLTGGSPQSIGSTAANGTATSARNKVARAAVSTVWSIAMPMLTRYVKQQMAVAMVGAASSHNSNGREEHHEKPRT